MISEDLTGCTAHSIADTSLSDHESASIVSTVQPSLAMNLDANTPLGRSAIAASREGIEAFLREHPSLHLIETDQSKPADIDGILHDGDTVRAVVEMRTRYITLERLMDNYESALAARKFRPALGSLDLIAKVMGWMPSGRGR